ncbi:glucose-1-phosphate thymidylyltransferase [Candidatus Gracilibacteria bacterium]|nr:MAG: glucose-1-phosphate thymidylyltransferase [Candidatus Gracilibacteria bacterium]
MKAIILAAGEGSRLRPLTNTTPKPIIKIFGKTIIKHNLKSIYKYVSEIIIVVKYKKDEVKKAIGDEYKGVKITYIEQNDEKGTAAAIRGIETKKDVVIMNGDSIFSKKDLKKIFELKGYGALAKKVDNPEKYGIFEIDGKENVKKIVEKPEKFVGDLASVGVYKFSPEIFEIVKNIELSPRGEYEITDAINSFVEKNEFKAISLEEEFIDVGYPWDILEANSFFLKNIDESEIDGEIEKGVTIKGKIILEKGAVLKSGTYIEGNVFIGKNSVIGPNAYLRGETVIGENCKIGNAVEIKNSSLGDNTNVAHLSYIGDSVIGNNVNIGGGFISANLRHDNGNIKVKVKGELVDTKKRKLGVIIGDNVKTGAKTMTMPGRVIQNDSFTMPGEIVK